MDLGELGAEAVHLVLGEVRVAGHLGGDLDAFGRDRATQQVAQFAGRRVDGRAPAVDAGGAREAIADAAVVGVYDAEGDEVPRAFVVRRPGSELDEDDVMAYVAGLVAPYKKVRQVRFVDAVPRSASGKILRRELRGAGGE